MDWVLSEEEAAAGKDGMTAFLRRADSQLRGDGGPIEGFTFLNDAREMLRISREIERDLLESTTRTRLYVGFQNPDKVIREVTRYADLRQSGVTVYAFGEGGPDENTKTASDSWYELEASHRKLENQWYLVIRTPEPVAFVGWEISDESIWGKHGISHPDKRFVGFVSQDARIVHPIAGHLDIVRASRGTRRTASGTVSPGAPASGSVRDFAASLAPRRLGLLVDDGKREQVQRVFDSFVRAEAIPKCDIYLYDLASASYLLDPYPSQEDREPFTASYVRNAVRRNYLADQMERVPVNGQVFAVLPTGVGFGDLGAWANRLQLDAIVLPAEYERPSLMDRIRGYTVAALREATRAALVIEDPASGPRVLRSGAV